jgi:hypothetical protein
MNLRSSFGKRGLKLDLINLKVDIQDTEYLSKYFVISEFNPIFTAGKNSVAFNGSPLLKIGSEIKVECIDSAGNSLFLEQTIPKDTRYIDQSNFVVAVHVYNETYNGNGKFILVGTSAKNEIVRWVANITIDKTLKNHSKVRFYNKPTLEVRPLKYPVISNEVGSQLSKDVIFTGSFYSIAVNPLKDTNKSVVSAKTTDTDYRLIVKVNDIPEFQPTTYPSKSFNSQLNNADINVYISKIREPYSYKTKNVNITSSYKIKEVVNSKEIKLSDAVYVLNNNKNFVLTTVEDGTFDVSYKFIAYNTASDAYLNVTITDGTTIPVKESYAEIIYRNIQTFSGFVARHKIYKKSLIYPGDFQVIADDPLIPNELLIDQITLNKNYNKIGSFYNQPHIEKYWFTSSAALHLSHSVYPRIDSMRIFANDYSDMDGNECIMVKADSSGSINSYGYESYDEDQFLNFSGSHYNSNFIELKKDTLYSFSANVTVDKNTDEESTLSFYITSSIPDIQKEKDFIETFGLKIGEVTVSEKVSTKIFREKQELFFTPTNDLFGTLVIVPKNCFVTLSDMSLKSYGDYGFSPDSLSIRIPFPIKVANETFEIKAELFDINSNLIFSDLRTIQSFDPQGITLYSFIAGYGFDITQIAEIPGSLKVGEHLFLPGLTGCPTDDDSLRYLAFKPLGGGEGEVCFTPVSQLLINGDYVNLTTFQAGNKLTASVLTAVYDSDNSWQYGRKICILADGSRYVNGVATP